MTLQEIGMKHKTDKATYHKYCDFYEKTLPKKINRLLEIGIMDGNSLRMWHEYYPDAEIVGVDIRPALKIDGVTCMQLDTTDPEQLKQITGKFDVIIDDGSHMTKDQMTTMRNLYSDKLNPKGYYVMEDIHTSFMPEYVNTAETTYTVLKTLKENGKDVTFWSRTKDKKRSFTAVIKR